MNDYSKVPVEIVQVGDWIIRRANEVAYKVVSTKVNSLGRVQISGSLSGNTPEHFTVTYPVGALVWARAS